MEPSTIVENLQIKKHPSVQESYYVNVKTFIDGRKRNDLDIPSINRREIYTKIRSIHITNTTSQQSTNNLPSGTRATSIHSRLIPQSSSESVNEQEPEQEPEPETTKIRVKKQRPTSNFIIQIVGVKKLSENAIIQVPDSQKQTKPTKKTIIKGDMKMIQEIQKPISQEYNSLMKASSYYLNNRKAFINFINSNLLPFRNISQQGKLSCDDMSSNKIGKEFKLLPHQMLVKEYMSIYTPYRGLLLYHGLGSGKTCSSIAIAEGLKTDKKVMVLTPASLRMNYIEELKSCGDAIFNRNQHWIFVSVENNTEAVSSLSELLHIQPDTIVRNKGAWVMDASKPPNYGTIQPKEKKLLDKQLLLMIQHKYQFISYNGLRKEHLKTMTREDTSRPINPFDNKVVIIDEVHNFISRIVNKIGRKLTPKNAGSISVRLYRYLMDAQNCKLVFLSGTPIINYPNEIGVLFNMLRGYIITWDISIKVRASEKVDTAYIRNVLKNITSVDYIKYTPSTGILQITKNPFGFSNNPDNERMKTKDTTSDMTNKDFQTLVVTTLRENSIDVPDSGIHVTYNKALPDEKDEFNKLFLNSQPGIDSKDIIQNSLLFKRRIIGLTSYFRSAQEQLMPRYVPSGDMKVFKIPMSNEQFAIYNKARNAEREQERNTAKKRNKNQSNVDALIEPTSTYRIFSRLFCNFVFPPEIPRPLPQDGMSLEAYIAKTNMKVDENDVDGVSSDEKVANVNNEHELDDEVELRDQQKEVVDTEYQKRIEHAIQLLTKKSDIYFTKTNLMKYSPKYLQILDNLQNEEYTGLQLIYSQFRTLEGIGILRIVLIANGFAEFKLKQDNGWKLDIDPEKDLGKPRFVLYTGTETNEEKEIIRNVFNSNLNAVPSTLRNQLKTYGEDNKNGDFIRIFMITSSGAEGISLKNVNYVHIVEPYWHPVRMEQVIGRARRICSHQELPEPKRFVKVFMYLMKVTQEQRDSEDSTEMVAFDVSKRNSNIVHTTDETLFEISDMKREMNDTLLRYVKETSIDCTINTSINKTEKLECYSFGNTNNNSAALSYSASYNQEENDEVQQQNVQVREWKEAQLIELVTKDNRRVKYVVRIKNDDEPIINELYGNLTDEVYDYDSYIQAKDNPKNQVIYIGRLLITQKEGKDGIIKPHYEVIEANP